MFVCEQCLIAENRRESEKTLRPSGTPEEAIDYLCKKNAECISGWFTFRPCSVGPCEMCGEKKVCLVNG